MKKENIYGSLGILPKEEMLEAKQNFQKLTIGIPKEKLCTHCWDGSSHF